MEDVWRGEVQDLLSQISQLQAENKRLLQTLPPTEPPILEEESEKQEGEFSENWSLTFVEKIFIHFLICDIQNMFAYSREFLYGYYQFYGCPCMIQNSIITCNTAFN